jgi:hypothetical protein
MSELTHREILLSALLLILLALVLWVTLPSLLPLVQWP